MSGSDTGKAKQALSALNEKFQEMKRDVADASAETQKASPVFNSLLQIFKNYLAPMQIFHMAIRMVKQLAQESISLGSTMADLQIVTRASNEEMERFSKNAIESAKNLGVSVEDIVTATTTYARLGYTASQSSGLAELTSQLERVGDIDA